MKIAWFSCGATSAVACKLALQMYDDFANIEDPQTQLVMSGQMSINETK